MLPKKNPNFNVKNYKFIFFSIGLVFSLLLINYIFEWKTIDNNDASVMFASTDIIEEEIQDIPQTEVPPPPPPDIPLQSPEIIEVDDDEVLEELDVNFDAEVNDDVPVSQGNGKTQINNQITTPVIPPPPPKKEIEDKVFIMAEEQPTPIGGMENFYSYVSNNLKYPKQARRNNISGRVYIEFIVDRDGSLEYFKVLKGIGYGCDEEAIRVLKTAPKWNPGKQRGKTVKVRMSVPIIFILK